jgi:PAS domain S-box-containing protein
MTYGAIANIRKRYFFSLTVISLVISYYFYNEFNDTSLIFSLAVVVFISFYSGCIYGILSILISAFSFTLLFYTENQYSLSSRHTFFISIFVFVSVSLLWFLVSLRDSIEKIKENIEKKIQNRTSELVATNSKLEMFVNEQRGIVNQLRYSEKFIVSLFENIPSMIFVKDAKDLKFVMFNKARKELIGVRREELIGKNDYGFFPKDQADFFVEKDRAVIDSKVMADIQEEVINTKNKGKRTLHTRKVVVLDDKGEAQYLLGISEDITERKQAEVEIDRSKKYVNFLVDEKK